MNRDGQFDLVEMIIVGPLLFSYYFFIFGIAVWFIKFIIMGLTWLSYFFL